jgi:hypothetical protein
MEETRKPVGNRWVVAIWIIVFLMVTAFGLFVSQKLKFSPAVPTGPLLTAEFPDGGTLEIIGVSVRERVVEINPPKMFSIPFLSPKGFTGGTYGGLNIDTQEEGGKVLSTRITSWTPAAMFIEFRMKDAHGAGMTFPAFLTDDAMVWEDKRFGKSMSPKDLFKPKNMDLETVRIAMAGAGLQVLFQFHDPDAGWIHLMGPSLFYEPWPDRYIATLNAWRREIPTLDFRAVREDGEVVEFSLPNPDFKKVAAKTPAPISLPFVFKSKNFSLTANHVRRIAISGNLPLAAVDLKLEYLGKPVPGLKDGPIRLVWQSAPAADEWGNEVKFGRNTIRKESLTGAKFPLSSKRLSLDVIVERTEDYPHSQYSGCMVLEGKVSDDGLEVHFDPGPDAALLGITSMPVGKIRKNAPGDKRDPTRGWSQLEMKIQGKGDQLETVQRRIGEIQKCEFPIFIGDRDESGGIAVGGKSGGSGYGGGGFHFDRSFTRRFPPGDLAPGTKVRVAMDAPMKSETLHLEFELPATVEPE